MVKKTCVLLGVVEGGAWSKATKYFTNKVLVSSLSRGEEGGMGGGGGTTAGKYKNNANACAKAPLLSVPMKY